MADIVVLRIVPINRLLKKIDKYSFLIVLFASLVVAFLIRFVYQPRAIVAWDEAGYMQYSYWLYENIAIGNWSGFHEVIHYSFQYPPLFTIIMSVPLLLGYPAVSGIRLFNIFFYLLMVYLTYITAIGVADRNKRTVAFLSAMFMIFSPMMVVFATVALREMMGAAFTMAAAAVYIFRKKNNVLHNLALSLILICLMMVKYNFGILVCLALVINEAISLIFRDRLSDILKRLSVIFLPLIGFMIWWIFIYQSKLQLFIDTLTNKCRECEVYYSGLGVASDRPLFYLRSIVYLYSPSVLLGIILLVSFIYGISKFKDSNIRFLWILSASNIMLGMILSKNPQDRYILTIVPGFTVVAFYMLMDLIRKWNSLMGKIKLLPVFYLFIILLSVFILKDFLPLSTNVYATGAYANRTPLFNQNDFKDHFFEYDKTKWIYPIPDLPAERPEDVFKFIAENIDTAKLSNVIGEANEFSPTYRDVYFREYRKNHPPQVYPYNEYSVVMEVLPNSKFYTHDYNIQNEWKVGNRSTVENDPSWKLIKYHDFRDLGVVVSIYGR